MFELAEKLGIEPDQITQSDMEKDFYDKAQEVYNDNNSSEEELKKWKDFLPKKTFKEVSFYDAEIGEPKFSVGDIMDGNGVYYLIIK